MTQPSQSDTTHLFLIRHGATAANELRPYVLQGQSVNGSLSQTGRQQAVQVGRFLGRFTLNHVYASPLRRAIETAQVIADHHSVPVRPVDDIIEVNVGEWEQMDWESIMREYPEDYRKFIDDPAKHGYRGGESYTDVLQRAEPLIRGLLQQHQGETIAIVAHNVVNRVYLASLMGLELGKARDLRQENACINVIRHRDGQSTLMTMNAHFHIKETLL